MDESKFRELLRDELSISFSQSARLISRAPYAYKKYKIKKAGGGYREIAQPAKETKFIMHWLMSKYFYKLPVHLCATAYKDGSSIKGNAWAHAKNYYIAKFDFKKFFPSIVGRDLELHFTDFFSGVLDDKSINQIARLCCVSHNGSDSSKLCLSIGAPTSPVLSNSVMREFDEHIHSWCVNNSIVYTRYADDLTFSTKVRGVSFEIQPMLDEVIGKLHYPKLTLNDKKTIFLSKKNQRRITGVVINNNDDVSLGRSRKREISVLIHKFSINFLSEEEVFRLQGLLGFAKDVEPLFIVRMRDKYGDAILSRIFAIRHE